DLRGTAARVRPASGVRRSARGGARPGVARGVAAPSSGGTAARVDLQRGGYGGPDRGHCAGDDLSRGAVHGARVLDSRLLGAGAAGDALHHVRGPGPALAARGGWAEGAAVSGSGLRLGLEIDGRGAAGEGDLRILRAEPPEPERPAPVP